MDSKPKSPTRSILFVWMMVIILIAFAISAVFAAILVYYRSTYIMEAADARLLMAAEMSREIVGPDYHDQIDGLSSVSEEQFARIVKRNDDLCRRLDLQYLWSVLQVHRNKLVFTSATHSDVNDSASPCASFFETHRDPQAFAPALVPEMRTSFSSFHNEWGAGRMVLVPRKDSRGRTYIFGASIQLAEYDAIVSQSLLAALTIWFAVMCVAFPVSLAISRRLISPIAGLTDAADRMASGDLDAALPSAGARELQSLSYSFNRMRRELKHQTEELRESEHRYRSLLSRLPIGVYRNTPGRSGRFIMANEAIAKMFGYESPEHFIQTNVSDLYMDPAERDAFSRQLLSQGGVDAIVLRLKKKDGSPFWASVTARVVHNNQGEIEYFDGIIEDITERKQAEESMRTSHQTFLTVLNSIDATIYVADMETYEILFMNKNMIETFGGDFTGEKCWNVFRGESKQCQQCTNDQLIDENGESTGVCVWQGKNPINNRWYINYDRAINWIDGRLVKLQIATDITQLKAMESLFQQSQKYEAIGTLAGGIAHDFNNLLMGIQGHASMISIDLDPAHPHTEHVVAIEEHIRSAKDLTQQLLGFARGGKYEVKPYDINQLVSSSANMFARTRKEIRIHTKLHDPPPVAMVDLKQIEQVLLNLYINAWQAMPDGGDLYLETKVVSLDDDYCNPHGTKPGRYAKISITDTGIGMVESIRQRVFDPFFTTKNKERGSGLGLASAYGIIKNHKGIITVYSEVGHGSNFNIYLPVSDKEAYRSTITETGIARGTGTILLVDDEKMIIDVGKAMLNELGYRVVVAEEGKQAVEMISEMGDEIDLVILDMIMPSIDGGKTFDRIRRIKPKLPVILSSGYSLNGQATEIMDKGCNAFFQKPFNLVELSQMVRKILSESKSSTKQ